jgi:type I site-specific restriction endonuclease
VKLNFPDFSFQIKTQKSKNYIFDVIRNKYVVLTPEEWVRQHVIHQLISNKFPQGRISVERSLPNSNKRYDAVFYNKDLKPVLLIECKAPSVKINQNTLNQVSTYISLLDIPNVLISNGLSHFFISRNVDGLQIVQEIPQFSAISN